MRYRIDSDYAAEDKFACIEREAALALQHKRLHEGGCLTNLAGSLGNMSGGAPESMARHSATLSGDPEDNPERATLRYLLSIGPVDSVPVKPLSQLRPVRPMTPHPNACDPKPRNAYALVASAAAHAIRIEAGARIPRRFRYDGVDVTENGVARYPQSGRSSAHPRRRSKMRCSNWTSGRREW